MKIFCEISHRVLPLQKSLHGGNRDWVRLVWVVVISTFLSIFVLHTLLSLTSQPPPVCHAVYTQVSGQCKHLYTLKCSIPLAPMQVPRDVELKNKVLLAAYYRGGSSFFGKFFQSNEDVLYWFEPLRPLYGDFKYHQQHNMTNETQV